MSSTISAGKLRNLDTLANRGGRFCMLAIDQRTSLQHALAAALQIPPAEVTFDQMAAAKRVITHELAPFATALLTDPIFGYPYSAPFVPGDAGLLLAYEETQDDKADGPRGKESRCRLIEGWDLGKAARAGANAVKLLLKYRPGASDATCRFQQDLTARVGEECAKHDLPFLLELTSYALDEGGSDTPAYARQKPELVAESARIFSDPRFGVDVLKLEFPADLKYTEEYCRHVFDSKDREPVYPLSAAREACQRLDQASALPWVILSAGVDIQEFILNVELASDAGASGFLCGRAIWKDAVPVFRQGEPAMAQFLQSTAARNFRMANAAAANALPWYNHRSIRGRKALTIAGQGDHWYQTY